MHEIRTQKFDEFSLSIAVDQTDRDYYNFHKVRYQYLISTILELNQKYNFKTILDIGASFQTRLLDQEIDGVTIDTLGFVIDRFKPVNNSTSEITFDLSLSEKRADDLKALTGKYDLIILAEVIEHMHIKPEKVLKLLKTMLKKDGILIIQTPNAAFVGNRIKLLLGKNPNSWIRDDESNPGHFREYTKKELVDLAQRMGFSVISITGHNYFNHPSKVKKLALNLTRVLPETMKNGFTMIVQNQN